MIKVITFDLGNVLFDFDPLRAAKGFLRLTENKINPFDILRFFQGSTVETEYTEGRVSTQEFYTHVVEELKIKSDFEDFKQCYCDIFIVNTGTFDIAQDLLKRGYACFILSNTNELHYDYLCEFNPALCDFHHAVLSYKENCQKPQQAIYERLIQSAHCLPDEIFFTDDLIENVEAAQEMGIHAHHFKDAQGFRKELIKRNILS